MNYSVLTPAIVPDAARSRKKPNVGDQLILDSIRELIGPQHTATVELSSWQELSDADIDRINGTRALILAGANPLHDEYQIAPGMSLERLRRIRVPILPMGVGLYGDAAREVRMSDTTAAMLREVHARIEYSSWRCPRTADYMRRNLPDLAAKILMTGCPVVQAGRKSRSPSPVDEGLGAVAVTVTERGSGWWAREMRILDTVQRDFRGREAILVLHQQFEPSRSNTLLRRWFPRRYAGPTDLHTLARDRGMQVVCPTSTTEMREFYRTASVHVGSRLHAHLFFLSQNKTSYLFAVDGRAEGFAESLRFQLLDGRESALGGRSDFATVQAAISDLWNNPMRLFLDSVGRCLA